MRKRPHVEEALFGVDEIGEARAALGAVDVGDVDGAASHALKWMQDNEAGTIGDEVRSRPGGAGEPQRATRLADDFRGPGQVAVAGATQRLERHPEAALCLIDAQIGHLRRRRAPISVAHQEGDAAQYLDVAEADPTQRAIFERCRNRAGLELDALRHSLGRAEQCDRAISHRGALKESGISGASSRCVPLHRTIGYSYAS
jgi:hypothetical protein